MNTWYYANSNGQSCGPFTKEYLKKLVNVGILTSDSLVYCSERGWVRAEETELKNLFHREKVKELPTTPTPMFKPKQMPSLRRFLTAMCNSRHVISYLWRDAEK